MKHSKKFQLFSMCLILSILTHVPGSIADPDYSFLNFVTYFGGADNDYGFSIAIDSNNNVYVTGYTDSPDFPTLNAYNSTFGGGRDAFVNSFSSDGGPTSNTSASPSDPLPLDLFVFIFSLAGIVIIQKRRH